MLKKFDVKYIFSGLLILAVLIAILIYFFPPRRPKSDLTKNVKTYSTNTTTMTPLIDYPYTTTMSPLIDYLYTTTMSPLVFEGYQIMPVIITNNSNTITVTDNVGNVAFLNGVYNFSASSVSTSGGGTTWNPVFAFSKTNTTHSWQSVRNRYSNDTPISSYTSTISTIIENPVFLTTAPPFLNLMGEYIQIQLPVAMTITGYELQNGDINWANGGISLGYLCGSNDNITYKLLDTINITNTDNQIDTVFRKIPNQTGLYIYYRLIFNKVFRLATTPLNYTQATIKKWALWGLPLLK